MDPTLKKRYLIGGLVLLLVLAGIGGVVSLEKGSLGGGRGVAGHC